MHSDHDRYPMCNERQRLGAPQPSASDDLEESRHCQIILDVLLLRNGHGLDSLPVESR